MHFAQRSGLSAVMVFCVLLIQAQNPIRTTYDEVNYYAEYFMSSPDCR